MLMVYLPWRQHAFESGSPWKSLGSAPPEHNWSSVMSHPQSPTKLAYLGRETNGLGVPRFADYQVPTVLVQVEAMWLLWSAYTSGNNCKYMCNYNNIHAHTRRHQATESGRLVNAFYQLPSIHQVRHRGLQGSNYMCTSHVWRVWTSKQNTWESHWS
jgi:hypothetical protein